MVIVKRCGNVGKIFRAKSFLLFISKFATHFTRLM